MKLNFHRAAAVGLLSLLPSLVIAQDATDEQLQNRARTISLGIVSSHRSLS